MRAEELKGHLDALLLAALEAGPRHGYALEGGRCPDPA
jgi:PadR family transcriptional regulator PadR